MRAEDRDMVAEEDDYAGIGKKGLLTRLAVLSFMATMLLVMPTLAIVAALNGTSGTLSRHMPPPFAALWVLWGASSAWIIFDPMRFLTIFRDSFQLLGPEEVILTLAGITNLVVLALCLAVVRF